jgi:hypothetical protein
LRIVMGLALAAGIGSAAAQAADPVKPGRWEFHSQLQMPGMAAAGQGVSHTQCVEPEKAVPTDPRRNCTVERVNRQENVITWSTSCTAPQGNVQSTGTARYSGNTMEANMNVRVPNGHGGYIETKQHITGRYLGPCR